jgi:hypothetical protein
MEKSKPITARQLASILKPFGAKPGTIRDGSQTWKGYKKEDLGDAFSRYLSAPPLLSVTTDESVTDENPPKLLITKECDAVTDKTLPFGGNTRLSHLDELIDAKCRGGLGAFEARCKRVAEQLHTVESRSLPSTEALREKLALMAEHHQMSDKEDQEEFRI